MIAKLTEALPANPSPAALDLLAPAANGEVANDGGLVLSAAPAQPKKIDISGFSNALEIASTLVIPIGPREQSAETPFPKTQDKAPIEPERQTGKALPDVAQALPDVAQALPAAPQAIGGMIAADTLTQGSEFLPEPKAAPKVEFEPKVAAPRPVDAKPVAGEGSENAPDRVPPLISGSLPESTIPERPDFKPQESPMPERVELARPSERENVPQPLVTQSETPIADPDASPAEIDRQLEPARIDPRLPKEQLQAAAVIDQQSPSVVPSTAVRTAPVTAQPGPNRAMSKQTAVIENNTATLPELGAHRIATSQASEFAATATAPSERVSSAPFETASTASLHQQTNPQAPPAAVATPTAQPLQQTTLTPQATSASAPVPAQVEAVIEQLDTVREVARTSRPEMTLRHSEFGAVHIRLEGAVTDLRATLNARDPGFAPAVQAALAERTIVPAPEAAAGGGQRGSDSNQGQPGSQSNAWHSASPGSDGRYGSSPGSGQGSSQPYFDNQERERRAEAARDQEDINHMPSPVSQERGLFA